MGGERVRPRCTVFVKGYGGAQLLWHCVSFWHMVLVECVVELAGLATRCVLQLPAA